MNEQLLFQEKQQANIFVKLLQKYLPFWPLFALTIPISLGVTYILLKFEIPIYVVNAKVLLKDPNKNNGDSKILDALNIFSEKKIVDNEILVLKSSSIIQKVVKSLDLYATVCNHGNIKEEELYGSNAPLHFLTKEEDGIKVKNQFFFNLNWQERTIDINNQKVSFDSSLVLDGIAYRMVVNESYNKHLLGKKYFLKITPVAEVAQSISGRIRAAPLSNISTVLDVKFDTPVPARGEDILNKTFEIYNLEGIQDKNQIADKTLNFIENRLQLVISQLDSVEKNIVRYKAKESLFAIGSQAQLYIGKVQELDKRNADIDLQLDLLKEVKNYIQSKAQKVGTVPSLGLLTDPILVNLLTQLYAAEFDRDKIITISGQLSESTLLAQEKVRRLKADIQENLLNIQTNLLTIKGGVIAQTNESNGLLSQIPQKERGLLEISRQQTIKNSIYTFLLQKREETALSSASTSSDLRIIEKANTYGPISPISKNFYTTGMILGILSALFLVLIKEQFKSKILFRDEIADKISIPFVGEIVQANSKNPIVILDGKRTVIAEQFRALRTNINFVGLNEKDKTLLVTSSISGEGKSFIAVNLAISLTLTGKKVALLELDLRRPKLSKLLNVNREPGISNYLVGKSSYEEILKDTFVPNLFIFSAGVIPPNPTELIGKPAFAELIAKIKNDFDYVIMDTAPIGPVTDALLLKNYCDVSLYVIRHDRTPKVFIRLINELHEAKKFNNMCLVFNGLKQRGINIGNINNSFGYGHGYGYGYGFGYGYGYASDDKTPGAWTVKSLWKKFRTKLNLS